MRSPLCYCIGLTLALSFTILEAMPSYFYISYYSERKAAGDYYSQADPCPTPGLTISTADECAHAALVLKMVPSETTPEPGLAYGCYWEHASGTVYFLEPGKRSDTTRKDPNRVAICRDNGAACRNLNHGALNSARETCLAYEKKPDRCPRFDNDEFVARTMCCACGGGHKVPVHNNTCVHRDDSMCDDASVCDPGTDCADCGTCPEVPDTSEAPRRPTINTTTVTTTTPPPPPELPSDKYRTWRGPRDCESMGLQTIYGADECQTAARALGHETDGGILAGPRGVVDGCSLLGEGNLFLKAKGMCRPSRSTSCECSSVNKCLCKVPETVPCFDCMSLSRVESDTCADAQIPCADRRGCASTTRCTRQHRSEVIPIDARASSYATATMRGGKSSGPLNLIGQCTPRSCAGVSACTDSECLDRFTQGSLEQGVWSAFDASRQEWIDFEFARDAAPVSVIRLYASLKSAKRFPFAAQVFVASRSSAFGCNTATGRGAQAKVCRGAECVFCRGMWRPEGAPLVEFSGPPEYRSFVSIRLSRPFGGRYLRLVLSGRGIHQMNLLAVTFFTSASKRPVRNITTTTTTARSRPVPYRWTLVEAKSLCFSQTVRLVGSPTVEACAAAAYAQSCVHFMFRGTAGDGDGGANCRCCSKLDPRIPHSSWAIYDLSYSLITTTTRPKPTWDNSRACSTADERGKRLLVKKDTKKLSYPDPARAAACLSACHAERTTGCCQIDYSRTPARCHFFAASSSVRGRGEHLWSVQVSGEDAPRPCADAPLTTLVSTVGAERLPCSRLAHLCHDWRVGLSVRVQCRKTCKQCDSPCVDSKPSWARPGLGGLPRYCPELRRDCNDRTYGEIAKAECPKTCGVCRDPHAPCSHTELAAYARCGLSYTCDSSDAELLSKKCLSCWDKAKAGKVDTDSCFPPGDTNGHCSILDVSMILLRTTKLVKELCLSCLTRSKTFPEHSFDSCMPKTNCRRHSECQDGYYCARGNAGGSSYQLCEPITRCRKAKDAVDSVCPGMCSHNDLAKLTKCVYSDSCDVNEFAKKSLDAECYGCVYTNEKAYCFPDYYTTTGHCSFTSMELILTNKPEGVDDMCLSCVMRVSLAEKSEDRTIHDCLPKATRCAGHDDCPSDSYCAFGSSSTLGKFQRCELLHFCSRFDDAIDGVCPADKASKDACGDALDLSAFTSPRRMHTGDFDRMEVSCSSGAGGNEQLFTYRLAKGKSILIGFHITGEHFDSVHELRVGETCPGNATTSECVDDPDGRTIAYYNDGDEDVVVTYVVEFFDQEYFMPGSNAHGNFTLHWEILDSKPPSTCDMMLDLADLGSPYNGTTVNAYKQFGLSCDSENPENPGKQGNEQIFKYLLPAGYGITIGQIDNSFDSVHQLSADGACPGEKVIECKDDPDVDPLYYYNNGDAPRQIFFIVDTFSSSDDQGSEDPDTGHFTIEWSIVPGSCTGAIDLNSRRSPLSTTLVSATDSHVVSCAEMSGGVDQAFKYTLPPGRSITLRVTENYNHFISELRVGSECPGDALVECSAELTSMPLSYHNKGSKPVHVFYHVERLAHMPETVLKIEWETFKGAPPSMCDFAKDLSTLTSPFRSSIKDTRNLHALSCGSEGNEQAFFYKLPPGHTITIAQTDNTFDSKHELRVGPNCPGNRSLACVDDPETAALTYTNADGKKTETVTFIVDSYDGETGHFTLSWNVTGTASLRTMCDEGKDLARMKSPHADTASTFYHNAILSCGNHGNAQLFYHQLLPNRGLMIKQTKENFESFRELRVGPACPGTSVACQEGAATASMSYYNSGKRPRLVSFLINAISTSAAQNFSLAWRVERLWRASGAPGFRCVNPTSISLRVRDRFACQVAAREAAAPWYSYKWKKDKSKPGACVVNKDCSTRQERSDKSWQIYSSASQYHKTTHSWEADWGLHPGMTAGGTCTSDIASAYVQCCTGPVGSQTALRRDCTLGMVQYATAMKACAAKGGVICSMTAVHGGLKGRLGCGFDATTIVWTSDPCPAPPLGLQNGGFERYMGRGSSKCGRDAANAFCAVTSRSLPAWRVRGTVMRVKSKVRAWRSVKAMEGKWFVGLHGFSGSWLTTNANGLKRGKSYRLSWYERQRPGSPGKNLKVFVQNRLVMSHSVPFDWTRFQVDFTARSGTDAIKFQDAGRSSGSILLDDVRVDAAPSSTKVFWVVDNTEGGRNCDVVCAGMGADCVPQAITDLNMKGRGAISKAFYQAMGWTCQKYLDECSSTGSCITWGSPYLKLDTIGDKVCYGGASPGLATCGQRPENPKHRRLCPCRGAAKCDVARSCTRPCTALLLKGGAKQVVDACSGCSAADARAKCYPGAAGWPVLQLGPRKEKPNKFPPANHYCPGCKPCQCTGSGYGIDSCGELCCAQSPWHPDSSRQQCWKQCPAGMVSSGGAKDWKRCSNLCANVKCSSHSLPCSKGKCRCKDLYHGIYCDLAPGTPFEVELGRSAFVSKSHFVQNFVDITCESLVDVRNWLNRDNSSHVFGVSVTGQTVTAIRQDSPSGWNMNLRIRCTGTRTTTSTSTPWHTGVCDQKRQKCLLDVLGRVDMQKKRDAGFHLCCSKPGQYLCPGDKCCMGSNCASGVCKSTVTGVELGSGNPGDGVCQPGKAAIEWVKGAGSCTDVCAEQKMACSEYALTTLTSRGPAGAAAKAAGVNCKSWSRQDYGMGFSQCRGKHCCQGRCNGACFLSRPVRCDATGGEFGHQRICPCQDLSVTDGWLLVLSSDLGSGGGDFAKPGYGYPSSNFKTHMSGQQLHKAGFDMVQIVLLSKPRQSRIFPGRYDLRKLDNTCTRCNCPGNHLGGGLYWHGGGGKCFKGAHLGLSTTSDVHVKCSGGHNSWWGHFHRNEINKGVYAYGKNNCVSEKEWDQTYQLFVKKSSRCVDMPSWSESSGKKRTCSQYKERGICTDGRAGVNCATFASCTPARPCLTGTRCGPLVDGKCQRASKQCTEFRAGLPGVKPFPWIKGTLGLTAKQACCACGGGAVDACSLALNLDKLSSPYTTAIPESIRPRALACGDGARVQVFKYVLAAGSSITIGPASRTQMAHALYLGGDCPGGQALQCRTRDAAPMTYYNDGAKAVTLYYHVIDQHAWVHKTLTIEWKITDGVLSRVCDKALDLKKLKSPYRGDTSDSGLADVHTLSCPGGGNGHEQLHYYSLPPKKWISINAVGGMADFSHELRVGGPCPGTKSIACSNRPSTKAVQYHNTGDKAVTVYYIIDSFGLDKGTYMIQWQVGDKQPPNICQTAIDLTTRTSPYSGYLFGNPKYHITSCGGSGSEQAFTYRLPAGYSLSIGQTSNNFDSVQELLVGERCPGRRSVGCMDEPDNSTFYFFNTKRSPVTLTFVIDSFKTSNSRGDYTLAWQAVDGDQVCATIVSLNDLDSPYQGTTVGKFDTHTPSCGGGGNDQVFRFALPAGSSLSIGQTNADFGGTAELAVGGGCPGTTSIRCEGGSDSSGRLMSYDNTGSTAVNVYFMVDAGGKYDTDFTIEWVSSSITTTSKQPTNPCLSDPGMCLSFVNEEFLLETCERVLADTEGYATIVSEAKAKLREAYAQSDGRTLPEGEELDSPSLRCGSMWVDMPVPAEDQPVLRDFFRGQKLSLLINGIRVRFELAGETTPETTLALRQASTAPPPVPQQYGAQGSSSNASADGSYAVIIILMVLLLLLGGGAVVGFLVLRRKRRRENDAAAAGDGHVYTVEAEAVAVSSPVPVADQYQEEQFDKHEMEFDKHEVQYAMEASPGQVAPGTPTPTPISAEVVSYQRSGAYAASSIPRALSTEEAAAWEHASAASNPPSGAAAASATAPSGAAAASATAPSGAAAASATAAPDLPPAYPTPAPSDHGNGDLFDDLMTGEASDDMMTGEMSDDDDQHDIRAF